QIGQDLHTLDEVRGLAEVVLPDGGCAQRREAVGGTHQVALLGGLETGFSAPLIPRGNHELRHSTNPLRETPADPRELVAVERTASVERKPVRKEVVAAEPRAPEVGRLNA